MIIWIPTETATQYVYTMRSRLVFISTLILVVGTFFYGLNYYPHNQTFFYSWLVLLAIFAIDLFPMSFRQWTAKIKGKAITKSGNLFVGNPRVEIQK